MNRAYVTNSASFAIIGKKTTWSDTEGVHIGLVQEIWEDQNIAVCVGHEHGMDATWFVPVLLMEPAEPEPATEADIRAALDFGKTAEQHLS